MTTAEEVLEYLQYRYKGHLHQKKRGIGLLPPEFDTPERELKIVIAHIQKKIRERKKKDEK